MKLEEVSFGSAARDRITLVRGIVTAKLERSSGVHAVCLEGMDSTGRAFTEWTDLDRLELT
jgi:hypothetical protein